MQDKIQILLLSVVCIVAFLLFVWFIYCSWQERVIYKHVREERKKRGYPYLKNEAFLLMENDGRLLSLTIQNKGFGKKEHYCMKTTTIMQTPEKYAKPQNGENNEKKFKH